MTVIVAPQIEEQIRSWIESGQYANADAVLSEALRLLEENNHERILRARELVLAGYASSDGVELTEELMDEIEREAEEAYLRGDMPAAHVCP